ncbi:MAG: gamma-glutamyltransferase [Acidimicrobiia bacterium]|nr:gamma-glutamyltransferase [Acidimicrobiia bacterium]
MKLPHHPGRVMVAAGSQLAADAGAEVAFAGGNAVDSAIAAMLVSMATEPGIVGMGAGGFISIWAPGQDPVVIDGFIEMPGRGLQESDFHQGLDRVWLDYGGGVYTYVGYGSVGTPGGVAGLASASVHYGVLDWSELLGPAIAAARRGFPLPTAASEYLEAARDKVYGWDPPSYEALHHRDGRPIEALEKVQIPSLVESLEVLAAGGATEMYTGSIADQIVAAMKDGNGIVTAQDLAVYSPITRHPIVIEHGDWSVATNPAPAVGGAVMAALTLLAPRNHEPFSPPWLDEYARAQEAVLGFRRDNFDAFADRAGVVSELLASASRADIAALHGSSSTTHTSSVDTSGLACAITMSAGYGAGAMPAGMWMNNSLGEIELMGGDPHALEPGTRLISNMAPTVARHEDGSVLAIGSPGADRITTSLASTLLRYTDQGLSLQDSVDAPRMHIELGDQTIAAIEPGLEVSAFPTRVFPHHAMYFGGVQAASWHPKRGFEGAADQRRSGGISVG